MKQKKRIGRWLMRLVPKWLLEKWYESKALRLYERKVEEAEIYRHRNNVRVFVVTAGMNNLALVTRNGWREAKRQGLVDKYDLNEIRRMCVYCTATVNESEVMSKKEMIGKRKAFVRWYVGNMMKDEEMP